MTAAPLPAEAQAVLDFWFLPAGSLSGPYRSDLVAAIPFEAPEPSRRVALAWRKGFSRPKAIEAIIAAVAAMKNPSYRLLAA